MITIICLVGCSIINKGILEGLGGGLQAPCASEWFRSHRNATSCTYFLSRSTAEGLIAMVDEIILRSFTGF